MSVKIGKYTYFLSDKKNKKLSVIVDGKKIDFGGGGAGTDKIYEHFFDKTGLLPKSLNHLDNERRRLYLLRSKGIKDKEGNLTYLNPLSSNFHSVRVLW
jgi:hypothetical protein